ncbi:MAG: MgtC/SapB family protein [Oscillospiraceae bacterium]|jgi:putative Mg2+ transporter-C (MgtC) family protein|nr:MgtC/SapB family protein [Oscillospiraceae bacterium]
MTEPLTPLDILLRVVLAAFTSGVIGVEREHHNRPAGLRTHILVGLGAAFVALTEVYSLHNVSLLPVGTAQISVGRMTAQVISGIGFLGAGTIIVHKHNISGLTTAASLWNVACLGVAAGYGYLTICLIGAGSTLIVLTFIRHLLPVREQRRVEITFVNRAQTTDYLRSLFEECRVRVISANLTSSMQDEVERCTNVYALDFPARFDFNVFFRKLCENGNIVGVKMINT